MVVIVNLFN